MLPIDVCSQLCSASGGSGQRRSRAVQEALDTLRQAQDAGHPFALVLLDTTLPAADSVQLADTDYRLSCPGRGPHRDGESSAPGGGPRTLARD